MPNSTRLHASLTQPLLRFRFYTVVLGEIPRDQREQRANDLLSHMVPFPKSKLDLKDRCNKAWDDIADWGDQDLSAIVHTGLGEWCARSLWCQRLFAMTSCVF